MKVWDWVGIKLATPGSADGVATDCATGPGCRVGISCIKKNYANELAGKKMDPDVRKPGLHGLRPDKVCDFSATEIS